MIRIKICGITRLEDALAAVDAGADALGFVFADSPRRVSPAQAAAIAAALPPFVAVTGVFVDAHLDPGLLSECLPSLHAAQFHGAEPPEWLATLTGLARVKAFRVATVPDLAAVAAYRPVCHAVLLDARVPGKAGGSGEAFDWDILHGADLGLPLVLAGGLRPDNVADAIRRVRPYAVDVSTHVESSPGAKDHDLVRTFIRAARGALG